MDSTELVCKFCPAMTPGKYTCPRCNRRYCSSECYKSEAHAACSELFYRECFMEGLQDLDTKEDERHKIAQMLQRLENEPSSGDVQSSDSESEDLADRISDLDLDRCPEEIWNRLTAAERREFDNLVKDGRAASLVSLWTPWWIDDGCRLIEEVSNKPCPVNVPSSITNIPDITKMARSGISESVPYNIINILYGYAYTARLYNGEHVVEAVESAQVLWDLSEAFGRGVFPDAEMAIAGCIAQLDEGSAKEHFISRDYSVAVLNDVCRILTGKSINNASDFVTSALSDCHRIFQKARRDLGRSCETEQIRRRYQGVLKKIEFLVSWTKSFGSELKVTLPALEVESCRLTTELVAYRTKHSQVKHAMTVLKEQNDKKSYPLITEIDGKADQESVVDA